MTKEFSPKDTDTPRILTEDAEAPKSSGLASFRIEEFFPPLPESSYILIGTGRDDFMASRIARAVEDADANLLNMNVTIGASDSDRNIVHLRVSHRDPGRVARSLERYGYNILRASDEDTPDADLARVHNELMHFLSI